MRTLRALALATLGAFVAACAGSPARGPAPVEPALALIGGTIYVDPDEPPIEDGVVLISRGEIAAVGRRTSVEIPATATTLDCSGQTITAGLWNSHVHLFEAKWADAANLPAPRLAAQLAEMFTRYGFTDVFDTGSQWSNTRAIRDRIEAGEVFGPRIRSTGEPLIAPHAMPAASRLRSMGLMAFAVPEIADPAAAATAATRLLEAGVDGIKVHLQPPPTEHPPFPRDAIAAVVVPAKVAGKPVFVHPHTGADALAAVRAGVDVLLHTTPTDGGPWDQTLLAAMTENRVAVTPTLTLWQQVMRSDALTDIAVDQLRAWLGQGGTVLFGADTGAVRYDPSDEYVLMTRAGMTFAQILASLTTAPAARFAPTARAGRIAAGYRADLAVFAGDPSRDIRALADVRYTLRAGVVIYRAPQ